jgi:hypothetical protein
MKAIEVIDLCMKTFLKTGDLAGALGAARDLAPFQSSKQASQTTMEPLPADREPDPTPEPDEDVPPLVE